MQQLTLTEQRDVAWLDWDEAPAAVLESETKQIVTRP